MKTAPIAISLFLQLLCASVVCAATLNVPADYPTIQAAVNASTTGDEILVAPGTYFENVLIDHLHGGILLKGLNGPETTIIDGGRQGTVVHFSSVGPGTTIEGFTIRNGGQSPLTTLVGGGIYVEYCDPTIRGNVIRDNEAVAAGGIYVSGGAPIIEDNQILSNSALGGSGGGVYFDNYASGTFQGNVVANNSCAAYGGGVTAWVGSTPQMTQDTIVLNQALLGGGGVYVIRGAFPVCAADIVAFNPSGGGIVVADASSAKSLSCSDTFGNQPADYGGLPDPTGIAGNFSSDPIFCDLATLDFGLSASSPCASANSPPGCGRVGALDVACVPTAVRRMTWGQVKAGYH